MQELLAIKEVKLPSGRSTDAFGAGSPHDALFENLMSEVNMMRSLKHRHIVQYMGTSVKDDVLYLLLEYVPGRALVVTMRRFKGRGHHVAARASQRTP